MRLVMIMALAGIVLSGCKFYGSALPPEYPVSMDNALSIARNATTGASGQQQQVVVHQVRPRVENPSYLPEKELAVVAPPRTLLVWTYPHVTDDNTRVFGNWATIFLNDRYEWVPPSNEVMAPELPGR
jgi:hypothetical protein